MQNYLNETVKIDVYGKQVPVGVVNDYIDLAIEETAITLRTRLNMNRTANNWIDMNECAEFAEKLQEDLSIKYRENSPIYEMAAIAGGFINIRLAIYGNEGNYPHFHFYHNTPANQGIKNQGYGGGCLMIKEPIYFIHGSHTETLGNDEIEPLLKFLNSKYVNPKIDMTNWQYLVHLWNENNPRTIVNGERCNAPPPYVKNMKSYREKNQ